MRYFILIAFLVATVTGCARDPLVPPSNSDEQPALSGNSDVGEGPYHLWGEYHLYINDTHEQIDVVPQRQGRFHLNTLKFLESYCSDCLKINYLHNNGDGTVDLSVQITHPFPGLRQYTGFDVKGIVMFQGSREFDWNPPSLFYPENYRVSSRLLGDPELLNADGYTFRWCPMFDIGSSMPIFNYWPGKYSNGTPTANVNGFLNYYSNEDRHMFECDANVSRTYHIWLPPGPLVVGYAVEACWEPPLVNPVINPAEDFPITANQPEPYYFNVVINDGQPVTDKNCCNREDELPDWTVHEARVEMNLWYFPLPPDPLTGTFWAHGYADQFDWEGDGPGFARSFLFDDHCDGPDNWWCLMGGPFTQNNEPAIYQGISYVKLSNSSDLQPKYKYQAFDVFEIIIGQ
jgi:hypothetical protein